MNFFKRAMISLKRQLGKAIILFLLFFILGNLLSGALSVRQAIVNTENNLRARLPAIATVDIDREAWRNEQYERYLLTGEDSFFVPDALNPEIIKQIGELSYVRDFDFTMPISLFSRELNRYWNPLVDKNWDIWSLMVLFPELEIERFILQSVYSFYMLDVQENLISLAEGRLFTQEELDQGSPVILVSSNFAEHNQLTIGSMVVLENNVYDIDAFFELGDFEAAWFQDEFLFASQFHEFEIIGIFNIEKEFNLDAERYGARERDQEIQLNNRMYIPHYLMVEMYAFSSSASREMRDQEDEDDNELIVESIFVLHDPRDLRAFANAANELLPDFRHIVYLSDSYSSISSSMANLLEIADMILYMASGASILILSLLITLFLRDRRYEIGIYLALGERKGKILMQILCEVFFVAILAMGFSVISGNVLANEMSRTLLENDLISQAQIDEDNPLTWDGPLQWFDSGAMSVEEMMTAYETTLDGRTIATFSGLGIVVLLLSTIIPIIYTLRLEPKKVLM